MHIKGSFLAIKLLCYVLQDTSRDEREQCDAVDVAFQKRVTEMEDAKTKMEENLAKVCYPKINAYKILLKFLARG